MALSIPFGKCSVQRRHETISAVGRIVMPRRLDPRTLRGRKDLLTSQAMEGPFTVFVRYLRGAGYSDYLHRNRSLENCG